MTSVMRWGFGVPVALPIVHSEAMMASGSMVLRMRVYIWSVDNRAQLRQRDRAAGGGGEGRRSESARASEREKFDDDLARLSVEHL